MGNKKNIIVLSMLLLVFLLGLSTTSYASNFSETDFKNIIANAFTGFGTRDNSETIINNVFANTSYINRLLDYQDSYEYLYIDEYGLPTNRIDFYFSNDDTFHNYHSGSYYYFKSNGRYTLSINNNGVFNSPYDNISSSVSIKNVSYLVYADRPFYTASSGGSIYQEAGWFNRDFTEDIYFANDPEMTFTPINPVGAEAIRVEDNVGIDCIGVEKNSTYKSMKFGDLYVPSYYYITNINVLWWYYNRGTDRWLYKYILQEDGDDLTPSAYRSSIVNFKWEDSYKENETTIIHYSVWINRDFVINDTIYQIAVIGTKFKDGSPKYVGSNYFIKSSYTTVVDGILDTDYIKNTPYGDEYNNTVGDIADKVDDLDDLTNSITAGIGNGLIGASGDWYPLNSLASGDDILGTAQLWGFRNYTNLYWQGIYQLLTNTFTVLGQSGSVDLDVSFHGYQKVISSDDIVSPPAVIKDFISLCMVTFTMIAIYKHFNKKIENIQAADTSKIKNEADDSNLM